MLPRSDRLKLDMKAFNEHVVKGRKLKEIGNDEGVSFQVIAVRVERHRELALALGLLLPSKTSKLDP